MCIRDREEKYQKNAEASHRFLAICQEWASKQGLNVSKINAGFSSISSIDGDDDGFVNTSPSNIKYPDEKVIAAYFMEITEPADYGVFVVRQKTSLRQKATHKSKILRRLKTETELVVLEKTDRHWWKVSLGGEVGYVKALLLGR